MLHHNNSKINAKKIIGRLASIGRCGGGVWDDCASTEPCRKRQICRDTPVACDMMRLLRSACRREHFGAGNRSLLTACLDAKFEEFTVESAAVNA